MATTLAGMQQLVRDLYGAKDARRGVEGTFMWFMEEVGELASAMHDIDQKNKEEEFADVFAWLCTLANISDVDLASAITRKYLSEGAPEGHK